MPKHFSRQKKENFFDKDQLSLLVFLIIQFTPLSTSQCDVHSSGLLLKVLSTEEGQHFFETYEKLQLFCAAWREVGVKPFS